jgi:diguanylate cyclase (GGDEF)-like protein
LICSSIGFTLLHRVTLMRDEMARMSITDALTGANNRRGFFQKAKALLAEGGMRRFDAFVIDLDLFKRINDLYGHEAGDKVLAAVGGALAELFAEPAVIGRTGGEEFAVLSHWDPACPSSTIAEAIRQHIMALRIPLDEETIQVTASVGYSDVCSEGDLDEALSTADSALYRAKSRGRNRVEAALAQSFQRKNETEASH